MFSTQTLVRKLTDEVSSTIFCSVKQPLQTRPITPGRLDFTELEASSPQLFSTQLFFRRQHLMKILTTASVMLEHKLMQKPIGSVGRGSISFPRTSDRNGMPIPAAIYELVTSSGTSIPAAVMGTTL